MYMKRKILKELEKIRNAKTKKEVIKSLKTLKRIRKIKEKKRLFLEDKDIDKGLNRNKLKKGYFKNMKGLCLIDFMNCCLNFNKPMKHLSPKTITNDNKTNVVFKKIFNKINKDNLKKV